MFVQNSFIYFSSSLSWQLAWTKQEMILLSLFGTSVFNPVGQHSIFKFIYFILFWQLKPLKKLISIVILEITY